MLNRFSPVASLAPPSSLADSEQVTLIEMAESLKKLEQHGFFTRHHTFDMLKMMRLTALGPDKIIEFHHEGVVPVRMFVPNGGIDHIQGFYLIYEQFWDIENLSYFSNFVKGKAVLDIGANIGNHALFWSLVSRARHIEAFEPVPATFRILERNIAINDVANITAHQLALGERAAQGSVSAAQATNRMLAQITEDEGGAIKIVALDDLGIQEAEFAKIDVEGHSYPLLMGGRETLGKLKPAVFIELYAHEFQQCHDVLLTLGYRMAKEFSESNYLFLHPQRDHARELAL